MAMKTIGPSQSIHSCHSWGFKLLACFLVLVVKITAAHAEQLSIKQLISPLRNGEAILQLEKGTQENLELILKTENLEKLNLFLKLNKPIKDKLQSAVVSNSSFIRGETEDSMEGLKQLRALSILEIRKLCVETKESDMSADSFFKRIQQEFDLWFNFAADFPYNEASVQGLNLTKDIRRDLLAELERIEKFIVSDLQKNTRWLNWLMQLRTPWPVDRVVLSELRAKGFGEKTHIADKLAIKLQKNPYLSIEQAFKQIPGKKGLNIKPLFSIWSSAQIQQMQSEQNQLQNLRLRWAARLYYGREKKWPHSSAELIAAKILAVPPMDYISGKPLPMPQMGKENN